MKKMIQAMLLSMTFLIISCSGSGDESCNDSTCGDNQSCIQDDDGNSSCQCNENYEADEKGACVLPCGVDCGVNGECKKDTKICGCIDDHIKNADGKCIKNPCAGNKCNSGTSCKVQNFEAVCVCDETCSADQVCNTEKGQCDCKPGFKKDKDNNCVVDKCADVDCSGKGKCSDETGAAVCDCTKGYKNEISSDGKIDYASCVVDLCDNVKCSDNGRCFEEEGSAQCECNEKYKNDPENPLKCVLDKCFDETCSGFGTCKDVEGTPTCECNTGYIVDPKSAKNCIEDKCIGVTCSGKGSCAMNTSGEPVCTCEGGYKLEADNTCVEDKCYEVTCSGNGKCSEVAGAAKCTCAAGYKLNPDNPKECIVDPCDGVTCSDHGVCNDVDGAALCNCDTAAGYVINSTNPKQCVIDKCKDETCSDNGTCVMNGETPECACNPGFTNGDGLSCNKAEASCTITTPQTFTEEINHDPKTVITAHYSLEGVTVDKEGNAITTENSDITAELVYITQETEITAPITDPGFTALPAAFDKAEAGTDKKFHSYIADFPNATADKFNYLYRFKFKDHDWTYCDTTKKITNIAVTPGEATIKDLTECSGVVCSSHGTCSTKKNESGDFEAICNCESGYISSGPNCVESTTPKDDLWCVVSTSKEFSAKLGYEHVESDIIKTVIYAEGTTNSGQPTPNDTDKKAIVQLGYTKESIGYPIIQTNLNWIDASFKEADLGTAPDLNNWGYETYFPTDKVGDFNYIFRFTTDTSSADDQTKEWTYCQVGESTTSIINSSTFKTGKAEISSRNLCEDVSCSGNGKCKVDGMTEICDCYAGYMPGEGLTCVENKCYGINCSGNGTCKIKDDKTYCECNPDYVNDNANPKLCVKDECGGIDCGGSDKGKCVMESDKTLCDCEPGYTANGMICKQNKITCKIDSPEAFRTTTGSSETTMIVGEVFLEGVTSVNDSPIVLKDSKLEAAVVYNKDSIALTPEGSVVSATVVDATFKTVGAGEGHKNHQYKVAFPDIAGGKYEYL